MRTLFKMAFLAVALAVVMVLFFYEKRQEAEERQFHRQSGELFEMSGMSRSQYIAMLKRTLREDDPELAVRLAAVNKSPAWP